MRSTVPFSITLPHEMADLVRAKVASGEYATESEVVRDGLRSLLARDAAVERWLSTEVAASYDDWRESPEKVVAVNEIMSRIRTRASRRPSPAKK